MQSNRSLLKQIERNSGEVRLKLEKLKPQKGWIHEMREALGITLAKLGDLCDVATPTIAQAERREVDGNLTLKTLRKAAEAMNCEFTYQFTPKSNLEEFISAKAYEKAKRILTSADLHMTLEDQRVPGKMEDRIVRLQKKLIAEDKVW